MGMFDYVKCDKPLPDGWNLNNDYVGLQTKDFDCDMTTIWITAEGRLLVEDFEYEEVPKAERPYPNDDGFLGLAGSIRKVNRRWRDLNYHGDMWFGGLEDLKDDYWVESAARREGGFWQKRYRDHDYIARFTYGLLVSLICDPETMPETPTSVTSDASVVDSENSRDEPLNREPGHGG